MNNALQPNAGQASAPNSIKATEATPEKPRIKPLAPGRFREQQYLNTVYFAELDADTPRDHVFEVDFWAHVSKGIRPGDEIKVRKADGSYWCWLLVMGAGNRGVTVKLLMEMEMPTQNKMRTDIGDYVVEYRGNIEKFVIIRKADDKMIDKGINTKALAIRQAQAIQDRVS